MKETFSKLPDVERLASKLNANHNVKLIDLINILEALESIHEFFKSIKYKEEQMKGSEMMKELLNLSSKSQENSKNTLSKEKIKEIIQAFSFDKQIAKKDNYIEPKEGQDEEYDKANKIVQDIKKQLENHLTTLKKKLKISNLIYTHMQKDKYQVEIQNSELKNVKLPDDFHVVSKTAKVSRYYDQFLRDTLKELALADEDLNTAKSGIFQRTVLRFHQYESQFKKLVDQIGKIDCLVSLAIVSSKSSGVMCRPSFIHSDAAYFDVLDMRHPVLCDKLNDSFISNSIHIGCKDHESRIILLTGPNMGGKSTLLRQLCILVVLAQIGCFVPASSATLSLTDRIFTRIGLINSYFLSISFLPFPLSLFPLSLSSFPSLPFLLFLSSFLFFPLPPFLSYPLRPLFYSLPSLSSPFRSLLSRCTIYYPPFLFL